MRKFLEVAGVGALVVGAIAVLAGVAWSTIPSADGEIWACYKKSGGTVRIIDESRSCKADETRISWNQQGPQGLPGEPGQAGEPGPAGVTYAGYSQHTLEDTNGGDEIVLPYTPPPTGQPLMISMLQLPQPPEGGGYLGTATFELRNNGAADAHVVCNVGNRMAHELFVPYDQLSNHELGGVYTSNSSLFTITGLSDFGGMPFACGVVGWQGGDPQPPQPEIVVAAYSLSAVLVAEVEDQTPVS